MQRGKGGWAQAGCFMEAAVGLADLLKLEQGIRPSLSRVNQGQTMQCLQSIGGYAQMQDIKQRQSYENQNFVQFMMLHYNYNHFLSAEPTELQHIL